MCRKYGFTLVEVLFVVLIAAGVIAFAIPAYKRVQERSDYNAAMGTLLDIGNAVNSLKRDLKTSTNTNVTFPTGTNTSFNITTATGSFPTSTTGAWNQWLVSNMTNDRFVGALFKFGYLKPIKTTKGYTFYVITGSPTVCSSKCQGAVACMCKTGTKNGCYYGAKLLKGGKIERLKDGTNCN